MGKRFAIVIGAAAAGVMALGAQTAAAAPEVVKYDTELSINKDQGRLYLGGVRSDRDRNPEYHPAKGVRKCMVGRRVTLFEHRPGADRKIATDRSVFVPKLGEGFWQVDVHRAVRRVYAKVTRKVRDRFVCRADRSPTMYPRRRSLGVSALGARTAAAAPDVVKYDTELTVTKDRGHWYHGWMQSDRDRNPEYDPAKAVKKCMEGRRAVLFQRRAGADRKLGTGRSHFRPDLGYGIWGLVLDRSYDHDRMYGKVRRKVRDRFVCRADRSAFHL